MGILQQKSQKEPSKRILNIKSAFCLRRKNGSHQERSQHCVLHAQEIRDVCAAQNIIFFIYELAMIYFSTNKYFCSEAMDPGFGSREPGVIHMKYRNYSNISCMKFGNWTVSFCLWKFIFERIEKFNLNLKKTALTSGWHSGPRLIRICLSSGFLQNVQWKCSLFLMFETEKIFEVLFKIVRGFEQSLFELSCTHKVKGGHFSWNCAGCRLRFSFFFCVFWNNPFNTLAHWKHMLVCSALTTARFRKQISWGKGWALESPSWKKYGS